MHFIKLALEFDSIYMRTFIVSKGYPTNNPRVLEMDEAIIYFAKYPTYEFYAK